MALRNFEISKTITPSDTNGTRVELPVDIVAHMEPVIKMNDGHSVDLMALDRWKQEWPLKYYTRPKNKKQASFSAGWRKFVEANGVLPGDELIFSRRQGAGEMQYYMIQVKRRTNTREGETVDVEVIKTVQGEPMNYF